MPFQSVSNKLIGGLSGPGVSCSIDGIIVNNISYAIDMVLVCLSVSALRTLLSIWENHSEKLKALGTM